jgi:hypothetical protein
VYQTGDMDHCQSVQASEIKVNRLEKHVDNFDTDSAQVSLAEIAKALAISIEEDKK